MNDSIHIIGIISAILTQLLSIPWLMYSVDDDGHNDKYVWYIFTNKSIVSCGVCLFVIAYCGIYILAINTEPCTARSTHEHLLVVSLTAWISIVQSGAWNQSVTEFIKYTCATHHLLQNVATSSILSLWWLTVLTLSTIGSTSSNSDERGVSSRQQWILILATGVPTIITYIMILYQADIVWRGIYVHRSLSQNTIPVNAETCMSIWSMVVLYTAGLIIVGVIMIAWYADVGQDTIYALIMITVLIEATLLSGLFIILPMNYNT